MAQAQNIGQLVRAIFQNWKTAGIDFLVLRNRNWLAGEKTISALCRLIIIKRLVLRFVSRYFRR